MSYRLQRRPPFHGGTGKRQVWLSQYSVEKVLLSSTSSLKNLSPIWSTHLSILPPALKCFYTVKGASKHFIDSFIPSKEIKLIVHVGLFIIMTNTTHKQNIILAQLQSFDPRWPRKHAWQGAHIMVLRKQEEWDWGIGFKRITLQLGPIS